MSETGHRVTITFPNKEKFDKIAAYAKRHKLTQGEVIEVLVDTVYDEDKLIDAMIERREKKVAGRTSIRAIIQRTKGMSAKDRAALLKEAAQ